MIVMDPITSQSFRGPSPEHVCLFPPSQNSSGIHIFITCVGLNMAKGPTMVEVLLPIDYNLESATATTVAYTVLWIDK